MMINIKDRTYGEKEYKCLRKLDISNESINELQFYSFLANNNKHPLNMDAVFRQELIQLNLGTEGLLDHITYKISNLLQSFIKSFTSSSDNLTYNVKEFDNQTKQIYKDKAKLINNFNNTHIEKLDEMSVQIMSGLQVDLRTGTKLLLSIYGNKNLNYFYNVVNEIDTIVCKLVSDEDYRLQVKDIKIQNETELYNTEKFMDEITRKLINPKSILDYVKLTEVIKQKEDLEVILNNIFVLDGIFNIENIKRLNTITHTLGDNINSLLEMINNHNAQINKNHMNKLFKYLDVSSSAISTIGMQFKIFRSFVATILNIHAQLSKG